MSFDLTNFNKYQAQNKSLVQKALTSATGVGAALIPQSLEKVITNTVIFLSPEIQLVNPVSITSKTHEFNQRTALPAAGGAMGESGVTPATNSATLRKNVELKVIRRKGQVTNFIVDTARELIDARAYEMENQIQAHVYDLVTGFYYGNATANAYAFDGWDSMISTNRVVNGLNGIVPSSLKLLDDMIDATNRKQGYLHKRFFAMSPEMLSCVSRLETTVRKSINIPASGNWGEIFLPGGQRLETYRGIPIVQTTATSPRIALVPTVSAASATNAGTLSGTYYLRVSAIDRNGETLASSETSGVVVNGTTDHSIKITLSVTHPDAYYYRVYMSTTSGATKLVRIFPALTYDANGTPTGYNGVSGSELLITAPTAGTEVTTAMASDVPLITYGGVNNESIFLIDTDPIQGLGKVPYANTQGDMFQGLVTTQMLASVDDYVQFLIKSYCALTPAFEATSAIQRNIRVA